MKLLFGALALALSMLALPAAAQTAMAVTVSACGTPGNTPKVGNPYPITMDTTSVLCTNSSGGGGGSNPYTASSGGTTVTTAGTGKPAAVDLLSQQSVVVRDTTGTAIDWTAPVPVSAAVTTAAPTYTTGTDQKLSLTTAGGLRVDSSGTTQPVSGTVIAAQVTAANLNAQVVGDQANDAVDSGSNVVKVGGVARAVAEAAVAIGDRRVLSLDLYGAAYTRLSGAQTVGVDTFGNVLAFVARDSSNTTTLPLANAPLLLGASTNLNQQRAIAGSFGSPLGVAAVEQAGASFVNITTATTTTVKSGAGILHKINIGLCIAAATITIYDNTAASGTKIGTITCPTTVGNDPTRFYDLGFATGLTFVTSGVTDLTVTYR